MSAKLFFIIAVCIAILVASIRKPVIALLFFLAFAFIRPQDDRPNLAEMRLPYWTAIALIVFYLWRFSSSGRLLPSSNLIWPFFLFFIWMVISAILGVAPDSSYEHLKEFAVVAVMFLLMLGLVKDEDELKMVFALIVICGIVFVYYAMFQGSDCVETQDGTACGRRNFAKINRNFGQPNYLGLSMVIMFNLAYVFFLANKQVFVRTVVLLTMAAFVWVLILTGSRGAYLALAASFGFYWLNSEHKLRGLLVFGILAGLTLAVAPPEFFTRIETLGDLEDDESAMSRVHFWEIGLDLIVRNPMTGVGIGNFTQFSPNTPHNAFIQIASEVGLPALLFWVWMFIRAFRSILTARAELLQRDETFLSNAALVTAASIVAIAVQSMTTGLAHREFIYIILALGGLVVMQAHARVAVPLPPADGVAKKTAVVREPQSDAEERR